MAAQKGAGKSKRITKSKKLDRTETTTKGTARVKDFYAGFDRNKFRGRPSSYRDEMIDKGLEYLQQCEDLRIERKKIPDTDKSINIRRASFPSIEGLANHLCVTTDTLRNWRDQNAEFSDFFNLVLSLQAQALIELGAAGEYSPAIVKMLLIKHGYTDTDDSGKPSEQPKTITGFIIKRREQHESNSKN